MLISLIITTQDFNYLYMSSSTPDAPSTPSPNSSSKRRSRAHSMPNGPETILKSFEKQSTNDEALLEEGDATAMHPLTEITSPAEIARREIEEAKRKRNSRNNAYYQMTASEGPNVSTAYVTRTPSPAALYLTSQEDRNRPFKTGSAFSLSASLSAAGGAVWNFTRGISHILFAVPCSCI